MFTAKAVAAILVASLALALAAGSSSWNPPIAPVKNLPGSSTITDTTYADYITINKEQDANLFYWFMECRNNPETAPLVLWMTGGPGCSSELAILFENGPFKVNPDGRSLSSNPYSWNEVANVLYIDQPYGTGFSYTHGQQVKNEQEMAEDMYIFLNLFLAQWTDLADREFYIFAESYGGHYAPALSARIIAGNAAGNSSINFQATAIGNGWVDPFYQYGAYAPYALAHKLIDQSVFDKVNRSYTECVKDLAKGSDYGAYSYCSDCLQEVLDAAGNINVYNIDLPCIGPLCYNFTAQTIYMNLKETQEALGVDRQWETCDQSYITTTDHVESFAGDVAVTLAAGVRVLAYSGKLDLICNYFGGLQWANAMVWPGQSAFNDAEMNNFMATNGTLAGMTKTADNFTWIEVNSAGHMVPHDQPQNALQMLSMWLSNEDFNNGN